jgi:hypothetical protein
MTNPLKQWEDCDLEWKDDLLICNDPGDEEDHLEEYDEDWVPPEECNYPEYDETDWFEEEEEEYFEQQE